MKVTKELSLKDSHTILSLFNKEKEILIFISFNSYLKDFTISFQDSEGNLFLGSQLFQESVNFFESSRKDWGKLFYKQGEITWFLEE